MGVLNNLNQFSLFTDDQICMVKHIYLSHTLQLIFIHTFVFIGFIINRHSSFSKLRSLGISINKEVAFPHLKNYILYACSLGLNHFCLSQHIQLVNMFDMMYFLGKFAIQLHQILLKYVGISSVIFPTFIIALKSSLYYAIILFFCTIFST